VKLCTDKKLDAGMLQHSLLIQCRTGEVYQSIGNAGF